MKRFSSVFLGCLLTLLVGCAKPQQPKSTVKAQDVQEGIGGDLAALYVKSVGFHCIDDINDQRVQAFHFDLEKLRVHSQENLPSLMVRDGNVLLVDRSKVAEATQTEIAMSLLLWLGFDDLRLLAKVSDESLSHLTAQYFADLDSARNRTQSILDLSKSRVFTAPIVPTDLRDHDFGVNSPEAAIVLLSKAFPSMGWKLTDKILIDSNSKKEVDAIRGTVDENGKRTVLLSARRLKNAGPLVGVLPALMIHETAHHHLVGQTGDDVTYAFTMKLFTPSMLFL